MRTRVDTRLCVTCHNPGSSVAGTPTTTIDFKVMVHRIHYNNGGAALPSVQAGVPYTIGNRDFSAVTFTQDVRNCTRCHDGTPGAANATPQGDRWKTQPSLQACGSCHDNVYFGSAPDPTRPYQTKAHPGGVVVRQRHLRAVPRLRQVRRCQGHRDRARLAGAAQGRRLALPVQHPQHRARRAGQPAGGHVLGHRPDRGDAAYDIKADARVHRRGRRERAQP